MTIYGQDIRSPYHTRILDTRQPGLWWSREFARDNTLALGDYFNSDPDPASFPNPVRAINERLGALTVRTQDSVNIGDTLFGSPYPRGVSFLIPDWLQGTGPGEAIPPLYPNSTDPSLDDFRGLVVYARLRMYATIGRYLNTDPFADPNPAVGLWMGPEPYVGDQASAFPFCQVSIRPDLSLYPGSPDTPPATYSTSATPPGTTGSMWVSRPGAVSLETWQNGPQQNFGFWSPGWGNSIIIRAFFLSSTKSGTEQTPVIWISRQGEDWQYVGDTGFDSVLLDPVATGFRRIGLSVQGVAYGALDWIRIYYAQLPQVQTIGDLAPADPFLIEDGMPDAGGRLYATLR